MAYRKRAGARASRGAIEEAGATTHTPDTASDATKGVQHASRRP